MIIKVGTNNAIKVEAVKEALVDYHQFNEAEVSGIKIPSGVSEQPSTTEETFHGAFNRAVGAFKSGADVGIGIESGITKGPLGWINFTVAVLCDDDIVDWKLPTLWAPIWTHPKSGRGLSPSCIHYGQSTGFPVPPQMVDKIVNQGMDMDQAAYACGFVDVPNIGKVDGGFLGVLTRGRVSRKTYSRQALMMALISWENKEMFAASDETRT